MFGIQSFTSSVLSSGSLTTDLSVETLTNTFLNLQDRIKRNAHDFDSLISELEKQQKRYEDKIKEGKVSHNDEIKYKVNFVIIL